MSISSGDFLTLDSTTTTTAGPVSWLSQHDPVPPDGVKYLTYDDFVAKHGKQIRPPVGGWVHGSRVMCAMRNKNTNAYHPRVPCYVVCEQEGAYIRVYLIQDAQFGSEPRQWPAGFDKPRYMSWTIEDGMTEGMLQEQVAYLGTGEGRNKL